jgi:hypothetical protein
MISTKPALIAIKRAKRDYNQFDHSNPAQEELPMTVF